MRKWNLAKGDDTSIYECTLEHWASYLAVNDTQIAKIEKVPARTDIAYVAYLLPFISKCVHIHNFEMPKRRRQFHWPW
ncbi:16599_t:CDS:2 [Entrophospora sp. SA101]|nr:16599_t:CDS:2 [Entrophospora sp. SA101]